MSDAEYSIAAVSKLTGVSCHALRVWERRYGFPVPRRAPSGHRRYGADQVQALREISRRMQGGPAIGDLIGDYLAGRLEVGAESAPPGPDAAAGSEAAAAAAPTLVLVDHLMVGDQGAAGVEFGRLAGRLEPIELAGRVIEPALIDVGERWFRGECDVYQEHCATGFLRRKLDLLIDDAQRANARPARTALIGTVQGDRHEGGVLLLTLLLELAGWRALSLGGDLPVREYQKAVESWRPDALALSFVMSRNIKKRFGELAKIQGVPIFVGGRSILNYQGLARRHGLIPVPGPASQCLGLLLAKYEEWRTRPGAALT